MSKTLNAFLALAFFAGVAAASGAQAQNEPPSDQPMQEEAPAAAPDNMQDMMQGGDMGGMMNMMTQMNEMMGACTKMMQAMTPTTPGEGATPGNPG